MDSMNFVKVAFVWHESLSVMQEHLRWRHDGLLNVNNADSYAELY